MCRLSTLFLIVFALVALAPPAQAAGTVTLVSDTAVRLGEGVQGANGWPNSRRIELLVTSDGSGNVSGTTFTFVAGALKQVRITPGTGGLAPNDNYDVTVVDVSGLDVLEGGGADRDTANATALVGLGYTLDGVTTLEVRAANMGAANTCTLVLLIVR